MATYLFFWDKLFGTFEKENEKPLYGLTHPLNNHSFMWQHFHYFMEIAYAVKTTQGIRNKLAIVVGKPEMLDQSIRQQLEKKYLTRSVEANPTSCYKAYMVIQLVVVIVSLFLVTLFYFQLPAMHIVAASVFILITLVNCGALLEQRRWIYYLENTRLLLIVGYLSFHLQSIALLFTACAFIFFFSSPMKKYYLKIVYGIEKV